jgi:hypothetical protein
VQRAEENRAAVPKRESSRAVESRKYREKIAKGLKIGGSRVSREITGNEKSCVKKVETRREHRKRKELGTKTQGAKKSKQKERAGSREQRTQEVEGAGRRAEGWRGVNRKKSVEISKHTFCV